MAERGRREPSLLFVPATGYHDSSKLLFRPFSTAQGKDFFAGVMTEFVDDSPEVLVEELLLLPSANNCE